MLKNADISSMTFLNLVQVIVGYAISLPKLYIYF